MWVCRYLKKWSTSSDEIGKCMVEGSICSICNNILWDLPWVVHEVRVFQLWLHQHNPWYVWRLLSCSIVNFWGLPNGANVKYNLLVAQAAVQWMCEIVECCDILVCLFCCVHYYVDMLPVHLSGIPGDIWNGDYMDQSFLLVVLCSNELVDTLLNTVDILGCSCSCKPAECITQERYKTSPCTFGRDWDSMKWRFLLQKLSSC